MSGQKVLTIAGNSLRRLFRDRSNIFWVLIAPLLFVFVLGLLFGGGQPPRLGVTGGDGDPLAQRLVDALAAEGRVELTRFDQAGDLRTDVERGLVNAGLVIPDGYGEALRAGDGMDVSWLAREADPGAAGLEVWVQSVVAQEAAVVRAAQLAAAEGGGTFDEALERAETMPVPGVEVAARTTGEAIFPDGLSQFAPLAPSMLLLYVFLTSLTAALGLIEARRMKVTTRMYATPTPVGTIVAGEALGRFAIALTQGLIVIAGTAVLFGVDWGDPLGAAALLLLFCLVGSGAAMLLGAVFRNEGPALGVSLGLGLGLAAVGGAMMPLEIMGEPVRTIARFTPHSWGYEGFAELVRHGGGIADILPQLGVLAAFAAGLFTVGAWQLRSAIVRP